jgi:hypothetical protein
VDGHPAPPAADTAERRTIVLVALALAALALAIQCLVALRFHAYCDENLDPETTRNTVCQAASDGGYLTTLVLPPTVIMVAGALAVLGGSRAVLIWGSALAIGLGVALPLSTALVAGYG